MKKPLAKQQYVFTHPSRDNFHLVFECRPHIALGISIVYGYKSRPPTKKDMIAINKEKRRTKELSKLSPSDRIDYDFFREADNAMLSGDKPKEFYELKSPILYEKRLNKIDEL